MSAMFAFTGVMHFVATPTFEEIVPPALGHARFWVISSGVGELLLAVMLWMSRTRHIGAWMSIALLIVVFPANIYMATQSRGEGMREVVTVARLPLQPLLIYWAWRISTRHTNAQRV